MRLLVENGADINALNGDQISAMLFAIRSSASGIYSKDKIFSYKWSFERDHISFFLGKGKIAELLIQKGADVNVVGKYVGSALIQAIHQGKKKYICYSLKIKHSNNFQKILTVTSKLHPAKPRFEFGSMELSTFNGFSYTSRKIRMVKRSPICQTRWALMQNNTSIGNSLSYWTHSLHYFVSMR